MVTEKSSQFISLTLSTGLPTFVKRLTKDIGRYGKYVGFWWPGGLENFTLIVGRQCLRSRREFCAKTEVLYHRHLMTVDTLHLYYFCPDYVLSEESWFSVFVFTTVPYMIDDSADGVMTRTGGQSTHRNVKSTQKPTRFVATTSHDMNVPPSLESICVHSSVFC